MAKEQHPNHKIYAIKVEYLTNDKGTVQVEFCDKCGKVCSVICEHKEAEWRDKDTKLVCLLCGADCT
jgi:hypothetical protein